MLSRLDYVSHPSADVRPVPVKTPVQVARAAKLLRKRMAADPFAGVDHHRFGGISVSRIDTDTARKALGHCGLIPHNGPSIANRAPSRPSSHPVALNSHINPRIGLQPGEGKGQKTPALAATALVLIEPKHRLATRADVTYCQVARLVALLTIGRPE